MALVLKANLLLSNSPKYTLRRRDRHPNSLKPLIAANNSLSAYAANAARNRSSLSLTTVRCAKEEVRAVEEGSSQVVQQFKQHRILWSDVAAKPVVRSSAWSSTDVEVAVEILAVHALCLLAPFTFRWGALWTAVALYFVTGMLGITLSYHRNLSHRSFKLPKWLEYTFAYCGMHALQGDPMEWVSNHRYHHQFCDTDRDPHSPTGGFWFSHVAWLFDSAYLAQKRGRSGTSNVAELEKQPFYRFLRDTYVAHPLALALLLYAVGGIPYVVWGMGVRTVCVYHITWLLNSACHLWGYQTWKSNDLSRNNWFVGIFGFGEGWHNNHHAFEYSARHGLEWWEVDMTWYVVRLLQALGLATDVKLPSKSAMQRLSLSTVDDRSAMKH